MYKIKKEIDKKLNKYGVINKYDIICSKTSLNRYINNKYIYSVGNNLYGKNPDEYKDKKKFHLDCINAYLRNKNNETQLIIMLKSAAAIYNFPSFTNYNNNLSIYKIAKNKKNVSKHVNTDNLKWYTTKFKITTIPYNPNNPNVHITTAARTCIDITRYYGVIDGLLAADFCLHNNLCTIKELQTEAKIFKGQRNYQCIKAVLFYATAARESFLETMFFAKCLAYGYELPTLQHPVQNYRADFYYPDQNLIVEVHGREKHLDPNMLQQKSTELSVLHERERERDITNAGYTVKNLSYIQVMNSDTFNKSMHDWNVSGADNKYQELFYKYLTIPRKP
ncbi:MAG: endonuclease domain-containing protein [Bifidobacteriaceae bacterium]|jgi:very-short-patch-repair endonuclease|nr:endonuclease domain-containing protein [Bifidobacteriaceae bacterium]